MRFDDNVRFRLEELTMILEAIRVVRPEFEDKVKQTGELTGKEAFEVFQRLITLYSCIGMSTPKFIQALHIVLGRTGNVERIKPSVERRRTKRGKAA